MAEQRVQPGELTGVSIQNVISQRELAQKAHRGFRLQCKRFVGVLPEVICPDDVGRT
jgi:hypothetical protein